jgi:hypothetical protein
MKSIMGRAFTGIALILISFRAPRDPVAHLQDSFANRHHAIAYNHNAIVYNLEAVAMAFSSGNVNKLSPYLDIRVDISLPDKSDTYSKSQAEMVISDFFNLHSVRNFKIYQQGENAGFIFCTGLLQTYSGNYRTTLFLKQKGTRQYLQEIRLQPVD